MGARELRGRATESGQEYTSAREIADAFSAHIEEYPRRFRRGFIAEKLRFSHAREYRLLSDALWTLKQRGTITFDRDSNMWENVTRQ